MFLIFLRSCVHFKIMPVYLNAVVFLHKACKLIICTHIRFFSPVQTCIWKQDYVTVHSECLDYDVGVYNSA